MTRSTFLLLLVGVVMCATIQAFAGWTAPVPPGKLPVFSIPKMSTPPVIDGVINAAEWQNAMAVSGIGGATDAKLVARPTTFYLAWDDNHLYMAIRTWVRPNYKPQVSGREPGSASAFDDGGEFHFQPMGKNVQPGRTSSSYKFMINTWGMDGDIQRVAVGQQFKNWDPHFQKAVHLTEPGSAPLGGSWWECEWAATTQDFELTGPNQVGDQWKFMLAFNHMYEGWTQARIAAITSYFDPGGFPVGTLVDNTPAVQMTMDDLPGPCDGIAAAKVSIYNPSPQPAQVTLLAQYADGQGVDLIKREVPITIPAGQSNNWAINEPLPRPLGNALGTIFYSVKQGDKEIFRYFTFFSTNYPKQALMPYTLPKDPFGLQGTFNPARDTFQFTADVYNMEHPENVKEVRYRVTRQGEATPLLQGTITKVITYFYRTMLQLPAMKEGTYNVEATVITKDGKAVGPVSTTFTKLNEAKVFSDWWNTKLGSPDRVIKPFIAMTRQDNVISMWGRRYRINGMGLPEAMISQGKMVSAAPARIIAVVNGKTEIIPLQAPVFTGTKDWCVSFTGKAQGAGLLFTAKGTVEQDGLTYVDLTYAPLTNKPIKVDALRIEYPLNGTQAENILCLGAGGNYAARTTTILSKEQGRVWSTLDTGKNGAGMVIGSFYPTVWVGNEQCGFLWYGANDKGWLPQDAIPAHELIRQGNQVIFRNNIIGQSVTLTAPRTIAFSYMASPFRPLVKGWRMAIHSEDGTFEGMNKEQRDPVTNAKTVDGWCWLTPPSTKPEEWDAMWAKYKVIADTKVHNVQPFNPSSARNNYGSTVHTSLPLMGYGWKTPDERVTNYLASDWEGDSWNKTEQDYFLWIADRAFGEGGLRTIYWDIFFNASFTTLQNGLGYELPDGRIQPGYNGWNLRRYMMRMYSLMGDHGLTPGSQVSHATNDYCLIASPWMDAILDGEYHSITDDSGMDWVDGYPIDRMRSMSVSENWGSQISWMNLMSFIDPVKAAHANRGFIEYPRLYDTWSGPNGLFMPQSVLDWGLNDEHVKYIPFWRNPYVTTSDADMLVSMWQLPDRVLCMVFNYNRDQRKDAVIKIDLDALKLTPKLPWQEFIGVRDLEKSSNEPATSMDYYARTITVPALEAHTGRLIGIRRY